MQSVVVFDIDGLSIRSAGCYGNVERQTPLLDEFASQARIFEQHYRMIVDPEIDRDRTFEALRSTIGATGLLFANTAAQMSAETVVWDDPAELLRLLEEQFDTEGHVAWIRIVPDDDGLDAAIPLGLIANLVEADVTVAITTCCPVLDSEAYRIDNAEVVRVPLMVWSAEPLRVQTVTSSSMLGSLLVGESAGEDSALVRSWEHTALREAESFLIADGALLNDLTRVPAEELGSVVDVTDDRLRMFRKPSDVWNIHNVLVEDFDRGIEALTRLRERVIRDS